MVLPTLHKIPGDEKYAAQVSVLYYLFIAAHLFGEGYHNWMIPWMLYHPELSIEMLRNYYPKALFTQYKGFAGQMPLYGIQHYLV